MRMARCTLRIRNLHDKHGTDKGKCCSDLPVADTNTDGRARRYAEAVVYVRFDLEQHPISKNIIDKEST